MIYYHCNVVTFSINPLKGYNMSFSIYFKLRPKRRKNKFHETDSAANRKKNISNKNFGIVCFILKKKRILEIYFNFEYKSISVSFLT